MVFDLEQEALDEYDVKNIHEINAHFATKFCDSTLE